MSAGSYSDFLRALGQNESGNNYGFVSSVGYLGRFQFGEEALQAIGFYLGDGTAAIDFIGGWTETAHRYGVWDKASFLASPAAQDAAQEAWVGKIHEDLKALDLLKYGGQWVGGGEVTLSGLIAGAHLVGVWNLKSYLETGGVVNVRDPYGTPVSEYVHRFGGYETPFSGSPSASTDGAVTSAMKAVLRVDPADWPQAALAQDLTAKLAGGQITHAQALEAIVDQADATTSVATLSYQFFTGRTPWAGGLDFLVSPEGGNPTTLNSPYYQGFNLENRYINFAVNLGKHGEGSHAFGLEYGGLTLFDATRTAYEEIFGARPTDETLNEILHARVNAGARDMSRAEYFEWYGQDGLGGVGTKAAMVGWLLAEAEKADIGVYAEANHDYLLGLAAGGEASVDLIAAYGGSVDIF